MAQHLKAHTAFAEDLSWVLSTHIDLLANSCNSSSKESNTTSILQSYLHTHAHTQRHTHAHNSI